MTADELKAIAGRIGYEWAMFLGACETDWHRHAPDALREPLRVVHLHARTELVWLHARGLYDFVFRRSRRKGDLDIGEFLEGNAAIDWKARDAADICPSVDSNIERANTKLFHPTMVRLTDMRGLPDYITVRNELRLAYSKAYRLMIGEKMKLFRDGLNDEWDVAADVLD